MLKDNEVRVFQKILFGMVSRSLLFLPRRVVMKKYFISIIILSSMYCLNQPLLATDIWIDDALERNYCSQVTSVLGYRECTKTDVGKRTISSLEGLVHLQGVSDNLSVVNRKLSSIKDQKLEKENRKSKIESELKELEIKKEEQLTEEKKEKRLIEKKNGLLEAKRTLRTLSKDRNGFLDKERELIGEQKRLIEEIIKNVGACEVELEDWITKVRELGVVNENNRFSLLDLTRTFISLIPEAQVTKSRNQFKFYSGDFTSGLCDICTVSTARNLAEFFHDYAFNNQSLNHPMYFWFSDTLSEEPPANFSQKPWLTIHLPRKKVMPVKPVIVLLKQIQHKIEKRNYKEYLESPDHGHYIELPAAISAANWLQSILELYFLTNKDYQSNHIEMNKRIITDWQKHLTQPQGQRNPFLSESPDLLRLLILQSQLIGGVESSQLIDGVESPSQITLEDWVVKARSLAKAAEENTFISLLDMARLVVQSILEGQPEEVTSASGSASKSPAEFANNVVSSCTEKAVEGFAITLAQYNSDRRNSTLLKRFQEIMPNEDPANLFSVSCLAQNLPFLKIISLKTLMALLSETQAHSEQLLEIYKAVLAEQQGAGDSVNDNNTDESTVAGQQAVAVEVSPPPLPPRSPEAPQRSVKIKKQRSTAGEEELPKLKGKVTQLSGLVRKLMDTNNDLRTALAGAIQERDEARGEREENLRKLVEVNTALLKAYSDQLDDVAPHRETLP